MSDWNKQYLIPPGNWPNLTGLSESIQLAVESSFTEAQELTGELSTGGTNRCYAIFLQTTNAQ